MLRPSRPPPMMTTSAGIAVPPGVRLRAQCPIRRASLAGFGRVAGDLWIHADVVERAGDDRDEQRAGLRAVARGFGEVVALAGGDGADDQPDEEDDAADLHWYLPGPRPPTGRSTPLRRGAGPKRGSSSLIRDAALNTRFGENKTDRRPARASTRPLSPRAARSIPTRPRSAAPTSPPPTAALHFSVVTASELACAL